MGMTERVCLAVAVCVCLFVGYALYCAVTAESFKLRKDSWVCTKSHSSVRFQLVGKTVIAIPETVCDQWTRSK